MPEGVEHLTHDDIRIFLEHESIAAAIRSSQEGVGHHVPLINMDFNTEEEAYDFYNEYATICGFAIKKAGKYNGKLTQAQTYTCNRGGKVVDYETKDKRKQQKKEKRSEREGKPIPEKERKRNNQLEITGCEAKIVITLKDPNGKWFITKVEIHHKHEMCAHDESKFLRSHKKMTAEEKLFIRMFTSVKLATRKIMTILTYLRGGKPKNVPYTKKDVSNQMTKIRQENNKNDMVQVLEYFRQRKDEDPQFYCSFDLVEGNKVQSIFWADSFSRKMYDLYGDCLSFDTTYKTNKYNLPFAPFVGITGHGQNCLFACAILHNETIKTFKWLFKEFLKCMGGKQPKTIITD
jgi:hypothetical protein